MATGGAQQQSVEYGLKVEIQDLKRALNDSLTLLKGNDASVRALAEQLNLLASQQTRVASTSRASAAAVSANSRATRELAESARGASINLKSLMFQVGALVGVYGIVDIVRRTSVAIYENARAYDAIRSKLMLVTDSTMEGAHALDYVRGVANRLGIEQRALADSYVRLQIASKGTNLEGKTTQRVFEGIATAASALRLSTDETKRAIKAIEQIFNKGKLSAEEIRQQLGDVLPGAVKKFTEAWGLTDKQFDKMLAEGKLFATVEGFEKLATILERDFSKGVNLESIASQVSLLQNAYDDLFQTIAVGGARDFITNSVKGIRESVETLNRAFASARINGAEFAHTISTIGTILGTLLAANLISRLVAHFAMMRTALTGLASLAMVARVIQLRTALAGLAAAFGGLPGLLISGAVIAYSTYRTESEKAEAATLALKNRTYELIDSLDLLSRQNAQIKLDAVREEIEKTRKQIEDMEKKASKAPKTFGDRGTNEFGVFQFLDGAEDTRVLDELRVQFGLLSGEAIRYEARLKAVAEAEREAKEGAKDHNDELGKKGQNFIAEIEAMRMQLTMMSLGHDLEEAALVTKLELAGLNESQIATYLALTERLKDYADANKAAEKAAAELAKEQEKAKDDLERFLAADSLKSLGSTMRDAFNDVGGAVGDLIGRLEDLGTIQKKNAKALKDNAKAYSGDAKKRGEMEQDIAHKTQQAYFSTYASMAGAAKSFFDEKTAAHKAMHVMEQGFRAAELAMAMEAIVMDNKETIAAVANSATRATASGAAAIAKAFEQMGVWGFVGAAAIIAVLAGLGIRLSGRGGNTSAPVTNAGRGTGTVLGSPDAESKSIENGLDRIAEIESAGLEVSRSMLTTLRSIDFALRGIGLSFARNVAVFGSATPFGMPADQFNQLEVAGESINEHIARNQELITELDMVLRFVNDNESLGALDWTQFDLGAFVVEGLLGNIGKFAQQQDSGLFFDAGQTLASVFANGVSAGFFATLRTGENDIFGGDHNVRISDQFQDMPADFRNQFTKLIEGLGATIINAVDILGADVEMAQAVMNNVALEIGKISLQGLSPEDVQSRISAVFSALGDRIVTAVLPAILEFQLVGEGLLETLIRVAQQTSGVSRALLDLGMTLEDLDYITRARVVDELIGLAGGIDNLGSNISSFVEGFYSDAELLEMQQSRMARAFAELGLEMPATREAFRQMVLGLDLTTESGRFLFTVLTSLSDQMDQLFGLAETVEEANDEIAELALNLRGLLLSIRNSIIGLEGGDTTIGEFNEALLELLSSTDGEARIEAGERLHSAVMARYEAEADAIAEARDMEIKALQEQRKLAEDSLKTWEQAQKIIVSLTDYMAELSRSALAPGTPLERTQLALDQFRSQVALALGGDLTAAGGIQKLAGDVLNMARETFASGGAYSDIYGEIVGSIQMVTEALGLIPGAEAQATLDTVDQQIAEASERADALLEQLRLQTIEQLTALGEYLQYGNTRLDAMLVALTGGTVPSPMPTFANGGIATQPSIFGDAGPEAAVPLPNGREIPVELRGSGDSKAVVEELRKLRQEISEMDQPINFTMQMPDGTNKTVALTLKQLRERSLRGEKVIFSQGVQ